LFDMTRILLSSVAAAAVLASASTASAQTEIQWWHALTGANNDVVVKLSEDFNASQKDYKVVPVYKGSYADTLNAGIAAFRAGQAPHILQVFEVGTGTMMSAKGAIKPVHEVMKEAGEKFDPGRLSARHHRLLLDGQGRHALDAVQLLVDGDVVQQGRFKKAGLDPEKPPKTWPDTFAAAKKLKAAGYDKCGVSNAWATWANIEQFGAWHNVPLSTKVNGMAGFDAVLNFNKSPALPQALDQSGRAAEGQDLRLFRPHQGNGEGRFTSGECPIFLTSSGFFGNVGRTPSSTGAMPRCRIIPTCRAQAAELDHRRRFALGHGRQEGRRVQGRRQVLHLPLECRSPGEAAYRVGLSADHCVLAVMADRHIDGSSFGRHGYLYKTAADLALCGGAGGRRRAVAVHVQSLARHRWPGRPAGLGFDWNPLLNGNHAMMLVIVMAAVWKQISYNFLFFLAGLQSIPKSR
jgi:hypothetical protein